MEAFKSFLQVLWQTIWDGLQAVGSFLSNPWVFGSLAGLLLVLSLLWVLARRQPSRVRAFANNNGYVEISRAALVDIIRSKSEQVDIENKPGVSIHHRRGKLHVNVKIRLLPSRRLAEVSEILQQHLREALQEGLGIRKLGNINITVVGVRVKTGKAARKSLPLNPATSRTNASAAERSPENADVMVMDDSGTAANDAGSHSEVIDSEPQKQDERESSSVSRERASGSDTPSSEADNPSVSGDTEDGMRRR